MRAEVIAVGTELLLGQIQDTNSSWIGEQLALAGIDCLRQVKVGDNIDRIVDVFNDSLARADALVVCGGLGPTQDDLTRDAIARVMGVELVRDDEVAIRIKEMFVARGREMPQNNLRQADVPVGASRIAQQPGTAPGLVAPVGDKVIYAVPGVPYEMREMVSGTVIPDLRRRAGENSVIHSRVLRTWGQSESGLAEQLAERIDELDVVGNPTLAFLASGVEGIKVRITAKAVDGAAADAILDAEELVLRAILGDLVFGLDDTTMEAAVASLLVEQGLSLAIAEVVTGGMMASRFHAGADSERALRGSIVAANADVRRDTLGLSDHSGVSAAAAIEMAAAVRDLFGADVGLATTGVAGPDAVDGVEPGTVHIGVALRGGLGSVTVKLPGDRERIRGYGTISAFDALRRRLADG